MKIFFSILTSIGFLTVPIFALASAPEVLRPGSAFADLLVFIDKLGGWLFLIIAAASAVIIVWAGADFVLGGGDPEKVRSAKEKITFAIVGLIVALLAAGITKLIGSFFNVAI